MLWARGELLISTCGPKPVWNTNAQIINLENALAESENIGPNFQNLV